MAFHIPFAATVTAAIPDTATASGIAKAPIPATMPSIPAAAPIKLPLVKALVIPPICPPIFEMSALRF